MQPGAVNAVHERPREEAFRQWAPAAWSPNAESKSKYGTENVKCTRKRGKEE